MNEGEMTIPHLFRCPISLDLFEDPVTLCTGQTYDRSSIEKWLSQGNLTCPVTMQKLHDLSIVPNHTLRHLINHWLQLNPNFSSMLIDHSSLLPSLKHTLQSHHSSFQSKLQALEKFSLLFSHHHHHEYYCSLNKSCFLQLGFLPLLIDLAFAGAEPDSIREISHHRACEFVELALSCILKLLPLDDPTSNHLNILTQDPKFQSFLQLFQKGTTKIKTCLCNLIDSAASSSHSQDLIFLLGNSQKLLQEIIILLDDNNNNNNSEASMAAIKAISSLSTVEPNREKLVRAGAIDGIIRYISESSHQTEREKKKKKMVQLGMEVMEKLVGVERGKEGLVNNPKGIETLVKMVFRVSNMQECSENAVGLLMIVCRESGAAREEAIGEGVLSQLLLLLQSQCSARTKTKARMLLKLLRSKWVSENVPKQV